MHGRWTYKGIRNPTRDERAAVARVRRAARRAGIKQLVVRRIRFKFAGQIWFKPADGGEREHMDGVCQTDQDGVPTVWVTDSGLRTLGVTISHEMAHAVLWAIEGVSHEGVKHDHHGPLFRVLNREIRREYFRERA